MDTLNKLFGLSEDEILVEGLLRKIPLDSQDLKVKLIAILEEEQTNPSLIPNKTHSDNVSEELNLCKEQANVISKTLSQTNVRQDLELLLGLKNKIQHWGARTLRLKGVFHQDNEVDLLNNAWRRSNQLCAAYIEDFKKPSAKSLPMEQPQPRDTKKNPHKEDKIPKSDILVNPPPTPSNSIEQDNLTQLTPTNEVTQSKISSLVDQIKMWTVPPLYQHISRPGPSSSPVPREHTINFSQNVNQPPNYTLRDVNYSSYHPIPTETLIKHDPKWNITFTGTSSGLDINEFLFRIETFAFKDRIPIQNLDAILPRLLRDTAEKWYWIYCRKYPSATYPQIKEAMIQQFSNTDSDRMLKRIIQNKKQKFKESFSDYLLDMESLNNQLINRYPDSELLEIVRENMDPALQNVTLPLNFRNTDDLRRICVQYERLWSKCHSKYSVQDNNIRRFPLVHEISGTVANEDISKNPDTLSDNHEINEFKGLYKSQKTVENKLGSNLVCWNCRNSGHRYQDCLIPLQGVFCFGCGKPGLIKYQCERCNPLMSGNVKPVGMNSGTPRPGRVLVNKTTDLLLTKNDNQSNNL